MSLSLLIGSKITKAIASIGIPIVIFGSIILFYEGVPFLNWWPANKIPLYGWVVEGEVNRRAVDITLKERNLWEEQRIIAIEERDLIIKSKTDTINQITKDSLAKQKQERRQYKETLSTLSRTIAASIQEQDNDKTKCNILTGTIPERVYESIR
jgi:hypothetical protein